MFPPNDSWFGSAAEHGKRTDCSSITHICGMRVLTLHGSPRLVPEYVSGFQGHYKGWLRYVKTINSQGIFRSGLKVPKTGLQDHLQRTSSRRQHR